MDLKVNQGHKDREALLGFRAVQVNVDCKVFGVPPDRKATQVNRELEVSQGPSVQEANKASRDPLGLKVFRASEVSPALLDLEAMMETPVPKDRRA